MRCDHCETYKYGFSSEGCNACECDRIGSKDLQCDPFGQCHCLDNVEGRRCNRCKENKYDRQRGCVDCPHCYNLVQQAVHYHQQQLAKLNGILDEIERNPTVINDTTFENKLQTIQKDISNLYEEAKTTTGAGETSIIQKLDNIRNRQKEISRTLSEIEENIYLSAEKGNLAQDNVISADDTLQEADAELNEALNILQIDGKAALDKANKRAKEFGQQSEKMTNIAQEARHLADDLDNQAITLETVATEAKNKSAEAYDLAKNTTEQQKNVSQEIKQLRSEISNSENKLNEIKEWAKEVHQRAKDAKDDGLTLQNEINTLLLPDVNIPELKIKADDTRNISLAQMNATEDLIAANENLLKNISQQLIIGNDLLEQGINQQEEVKDLLLDIDFAKAQAENAVELGDKTLKEAQATYETLSRKY